MGAAGTTLVFDRKNRNSVHPEKIGAEERDGQNRYREMRGPTRIAKKKRLKNRGEKREKNALGGL